MNRERFRLLVGLVTVVLIVLSSLAFSVRERHAALVTRFGKPVRTVEQAGLHWKMPWPIEKATTIDMRTRVFNTRHSETLTNDRKNVILLTYATWHVEDPLLFHRAVGTMDAAEIKLEGLITSAKIGIMGQYELSALVSTDATDLAVEQIEAEILASVNEAARSSYGIDVEQVGFKRISLPTENIGKVFEQMRQERAQFSASELAEGDRTKEVIKAETDLEVKKILSAAERESRQKRGEAEAEAARIIAEAAGANPELYRFLTSLESLDAVLGDRTTLILRTDSPPFEMLHGSKSGPRSDGGVPGDGKQVDGKQVERDRGDGRRGEGN